MLLKIKIELEREKITPIGTLEYESVFVPAEVVSDIEKLCKPYLHFEAGTDTRIRLKSEVSAGGKNKKASIYLNCADLEANSIRNIHALVRLNRNWIISELNPEYKEVL